MNSNVLGVFFLAGLLVSYAHLNVGEERNEAKSQGKSVTVISIEAVSVFLTCKHASLPLKRAL